MENELECNYAIATCGIAQIAGFVIRSSNVITRFAM